MGELGILAGHAPLLTKLKPGQVHVVKQGGEEEYFYISGGMLEVQPDCVTVLADTAERAADLDEKQVLEAKQRAEEALASKTAQLEYSEAMAELTRAAAQVQLIQKLRKKIK